MSYLDVPSFAGLRATVVRDDKTSTTAPSGRPAPEMKHTNHVPTVAAANTPVRVMDPSFPPSHAPGRSHEAISHRDLQSVVDAVEVPLSKWGEHAILRATRTDAWYNLMCLLNDRVQESIDSAGLMPFVDMQPAEQCALIEQQYRELVKLQSTTLYRFADILNASVDHSLVQFLRSSRPLLQHSVDYLVHSVSKACIDILVASPPEMATSARVFINRPLPRSLRPFIWSNALGLARDQMKVAVTRLAPAAEVLMARRCQMILERYFSKIASRANAAFTKTVVAHFLKAHEIPFPSDEPDCVRAPSHFDMLVFLAVPLLAVMKMFGAGGKAGHVMPVQSTMPRAPSGASTDHIPDASSINATATATSTYLGDAVRSLQQDMGALAQEEAQSRAADGLTSTDRHGDYDVDANTMSYKSEGDIKLAVVSGVVALTSILESRHLALIRNGGFVSSESRGLNASTNSTHNKATGAATNSSALHDVSSAGSMRGVSRLGMVPSAASNASSALISPLLDVTKDLLHKKHSEYADHLFSIAPQFDRIYDQSTHAKSSYLSMHLPSARFSKSRSFVEHFLSYCLLRAFSGCAAAEVAVFIWDQAFILGFDAYLPIVTCAVLLGAYVDVHTIRQSAELLVETLDTYIRALTIDKLRRLLTDYCSEELKALSHSDDGAFSRIACTSQDGVLEAVYQQVYKAPPDSTNYSMDTSYGSTASGHHSGRSSNYTGSSEVANLGLYSSHHHTHGSSHEDHEHEPDDDALLKTYSGVNTSSTNKK